MLFVGKCGEFMKGMDDRAFVCSDGVRAEFQGGF